MKFLRFETPGLAHYSYLLADGPEAAVVDPRRDVEIYLDAARRLCVSIRYVIETHRQEDFVMGSRNLREVTGAEVVNGTHECFGRGDRRLEDGETFTLGTLRIQALHTPGHTPESMCWAVFPKETPDQAWGVFTGDTLFFGTTGRSDLTDRERAEANAGRIWDAVHRKLARLGDAALVLPAHGPGSVCGSGMAPRPISTIGQEKAYNPVFRQDRTRFSKEKGNESRLMPRPPYFRDMQEVNLQGGLPPAPPPGAVRLLPPEAFAEATGQGRAIDAGESRAIVGAGESRATAESEETGLASAPGASAVSTATAGKRILIDTREPEAFAAAHIPGARSIWLGGLPVFAGWTTTRHDAIYLCTDREADLATAWGHLTRIGRDDIRAILAGGFSAWRPSARPMASAGVAIPEALDDIPDAQVLDVRDDAEFASGHIPGARHCYVGHLEERLDNLRLDPARPVVVTCGVGHRAGVGVGILLRHGFPDVRNLLGGMTRWKALKLPMDKER